jgi:hypothetical protein
MKEVTRKEFYDLIYSKNLNVHPTIISDWDSEIGYVSEWRYPAGRVFGKSQTGDCHGKGKNQKYWLNN